MALKDLLRRLIPASQAPDWKIASAVNNKTGAAAVLRIRAGKPRRQDVHELTTAVVVKWAYESDTGMPPADVNQQQLAFERAIDPLCLDNGNAELAQVFTGMGSKEWTFYVRSRDQYMTDLNRLLAGHPAYPITIEFHDDPGWQIWADLLATLGR